MIAPAESQPSGPAAEWHARFLDMVPTIERYARASFRDLGVEAREDPVKTWSKNASQTATARMPDSLKAAPR
jgi:hypothetical protein